jgi:hypothetical protein
MRARGGNRIARRAVAPLGLALLLAAPVPAHALRIVTWNLLNYDPTPGGNTVSQRQPYYRTVMGSIGADVVILQEMHTIAALDSFVGNVLNVVEPGQWTGQIVDVSSTVEYYAVCWKPAKMAASNISASIATSGPRKVVQALIKPAGYLTKSGWFRLYDFHLKAGGPATVDSTTRRNECTDIRNFLNGVNTTIVGPNFVIGGDSNIYGSYEGAYYRLTESQPNNNGRSFDPLPLGGNLTWHTQPAFTQYFTQAPCASCPSYTPNPGFSGGGLDDRFDVLFTSQSLQDGEGLDFQQTFPYGNDGQHYNGDINSPPNTAVPAPVADALWASSDHLPVVMDLRLASRVVAASQINFGTVIVGATASQTLNVTNGVGVPGDDLDYSFAPPAGFTAPGGSFSALPGVTNPHSIGMSTATDGVRSGTLAMTTDDPDTATKNVLLSGVVLRHADPSLDSLNAVVADTLRFGPAAGGAFTREQRLYNRGFDALQSRLNLTGATITGPDAARFTIDGGFTPGLINGGRTWSVTCDSSGMVANTSYTADLKFQSTDEALPGGLARPDVVVHLLATALIPTGVSDGIPNTLEFLPPSPNPMHGGTTLSFDLPQRARVDLAVYDLAGRKVKSIASGTREPGRWHEQWNATNEDGTQVPAGLYFARFNTPGLQRTARLVVIR